MIDFEAVGGKTMEQQDAEEEMEMGGVVSTALVVGNSSSLIENYLLNLFEKVID